MSAPALGTGPTEVPELSVIVPIVERWDDLRRLHQEFSDRLAETGLSYEFVYVVDGWMTRPIEVLRDIKKNVAEPVSIVVLGQRFGEAAALSVGVSHARGQTLITLAPYFQVEFDEIGPAIARVVDREVDLVIGNRYPRRDSRLNRIQAWIFHRLVGFMTSTRYNDISCGFRVMRRRVGEALNLYGDLHRFIPILAATQGFTVQEYRLRQRREDRARRYFGVGVYLRRMLDMLTVFFLIKFTRKPLRFFGLIGTTVLGAGLAICVYLLFYRLLDYGGIADRPLLLLGVLLMVLGVQSIAIGLLGEIIVFTHAREIREYEIAEVL